MTDVQKNLKNGVVIHELPLHFLKARAKSCNERCAFVTAFWILYLIAPSYLTSIKNVQ